jgi:hypothetical protein
MCRKNRRMGRLRGSEGQTMSEYVVVLSVITALSLALFVALGERLLAAPHAVAGLLP